jgi:metal-dependent hydrolase (beta-lactamase superfamily II)
LIQEWATSNRKFFGYYSLWGSHSLDKSLAKYGFSRDDITDVFMTHLHFDHCGGSVQWNKNKTGYEPAFKTQNFGLMKTMGMGYKTKSGKILVRKYFTNAESGQLNFIKDLRVIS